MKFTTSTHVTATERKAITTMITSGLTSAQNRIGTKIYEVTTGTIAGNKRCYGVRIATHEERYIGAGRKWYTSTCEVEAPIN